MNEINKSLTENLEKEIKKLFGSLDQADKANVTIRLICVIMFCGAISYGEYLKLSKMLAIKYKELSQEYFKELNESMRKLLAGKRGDKK